MLVKKIYLPYGEKPIIKPNKSGKGYINKVYKFVIDPTTGKKIWKHVDNVDLNKFIQAQRETCDLQYIVKQVAKGNLTVLQARNGQYLDDSQLPKNLQEAKAMEETIANVFDNTPILKTIYKNNKKQYMADFMNKVNIEEKVEAYYKTEKAKLDEQKDKEYKNYINMKAKIENDLLKAKEQK